MSSVLCSVQFFVTPWTAACLASLFFTIFQSLFKLMSIKSVMPSNISSYVIPSPPALSLSQNQGLFQWPKYGSFNFSTSPPNDYSRLISFRINWFHLLPVQGTLKSILQHHSSKASILWYSAFFMVQLSHPYTTSGKTIAFTIQNFVCKVMSLLFNILCRFVIAFLPRSKCVLIS